MTDAEIDKALAEKVMGWREVTSELAIAQADYGDKVFFWDVDRMERPKGQGFYPLTSDTDAFAVVDKMTADGWITVLQRDDGPWQCYFTSQDGSERGKGVATDRRRAICIAALKAKGAWEG